ncbi:GntR family transcriptional regulator [Asanoa sp. NPDC049573]|uniref:GntR family transcriptional regulator n=1 Tax=Asanoa sp. NPDC049573 TaxID=3155396 RepID=UPI0034437FE3
MVQTLPALGPARRRVLTDEVTDDLRRAIVSGEIPAGERLREDELAAQMKVSRGPIREALVRLEQEGLVVLERHRGARVFTLSREDHEHLYSVRRALDQIAVDYACRNATPEDFARMEQILAEFNRAGRAARTPPAVADWDIRFHDSVYLAAHNAPLYRAWEGLRSQIHSVLTTRMALRQDYKDSWEPDHRHLVNLLQQRKKADALRFIRNHVAAGYERIVADLYKDPADPADPADAAKSAQAPRRRAKAAS